MKHSSKVEKYKGSLEELAEDIGNLRYDSLQELFGFLHLKIQKDLKADADRGRDKLAKQLHDVSMAMKLAEESVDKAWKICEPHMV